MTLSAILDSSVFLHKYLQEEMADLSVSIVAGLIGEGVNVCAPALLLYEVNSVLRNAAQRGRVSQSAAAISLEHFLGIPIQYLFDHGLVRRGFEIATQFVLPTSYDSQYLALAERLACDLWTADRKFYVAVNDKHPEVRWLGEWMTNARTGARI